MRFQTLVASSALAASLAGCAPTDAAQTGAAPTTSEEGGSAGAGGATGPEGGGGVVLGGGGDAGATNGAGDADVSAESPSCTSLTDTTGSICDASGNTWALVTGSDGTLMVDEDGSAAGFTDAVNRIVYVNHVVSQENAAGAWWYWASAAWTSEPDPTAGCPPPPSGGDAGPAGPADPSTQRSAPGFTIAPGGSRGTSSQAARVADLRNSEGFNVPLGQEYGATGGSPTTPPYDYPGSRISNCAFGRAKAGQDPSSCDDTGDYDSLLAYALNYAGVKHIRVPIVGNEPWLLKLASDVPYLTAADQADVIGYQNNDLPSIAQHVASMTQLASMMEAYMGANEIDNPGFTFQPYDGFSDRPGIADAWSRDLWNATRASTNPVVAAIAAMSASITDSFCLHDTGCAATYATPDGLDLASVTTLENFHGYMSDDYMEREGPGGADSSGFDLNALNAAFAPTHPVVNTETGTPKFPYDCCWGSSGAVEDITAARLETDEVFESWRSGVVRFYWYTLVNPYYSTATDTPEPYFGAFDNYGAPKSDAVALHNLNSILTDSAPDALTFQTDSLAYSVSGLPSTASALLFEKSGKVFDVVLSNHPTGIWTAAAPGDVGQGNVIAPTTVTVSFGATFARATCYDPIPTDIRTPMTTATAIAVTNSGANVASLSCTLTDHPIVIEVRD